MRISRRKFKPKTQKVLYSVNENIRFPEVRLIGDEGEHFGTMPTEKALELAKEKELDLVVIQPKTEPPIAKIVEFGRYKFEKEKELRKQKAKQKSVEIKGVRLSLRIAAHDMEVRKGQAMRFLDEGNKVKVEIILRGREKRFGDLGKQVIEQFIELLKQDVELKIDQPVLRQGGQLTSIVGKA